MSSPTDPRNRKSDWREGLRAASPYLGLGMQLALAMAFFSGGGYLLDRWLGSTPWLTVVGGVVGMVAVFVQVIRVSKELDQKARQRRRPRANDEHPG